MTDKETTLSELADIRIGFSNGDKVTVENVKLMDKYENILMLFPNDGEKVFVNSDNINFMVVKPKTEKEQGNV